MLGEFGRTALQTGDIGQILQRATQPCAQGLETPFAKVLEYMPEEKRLLLNAGVGWAPVCPIILSAEELQDWLFSATADFVLPGLCWE